MGNNDMSDTDTREKLAELAHEQWAGWIRYMFSKCHESRKGELVIPQWAAERWTRQAQTKYKDLPNNEQASDRVEADKVLEVLKERDAKQ